MSTTKWLIIGGIVLVVAGMITIPMFISRQVEGAFEDLGARLAETALIDHDKVSQDYQKLLSELEGRTFPSADTKKSFREALDSLYIQYEHNLQMINLTASMAENMVVFQAKSAEPDTEIVFKLMMGTEPNANGGRGNGTAYKLREIINKLLGGINDLNAQLSQTLKMDEVPAFNLLQDPDFDVEGHSWEKKNFDAPLIANLAVLESLKIMQTDALQEEMEFLFRLLAQNV